MKTIEDILNSITTQNSPLIITKAELELIHEFELQPIKKPFQLVGNGTAEFIGFSVNFETEMNKLIIKFINTQVVKEIWYKIDYNLP